MYNDDLSLILIYFKIFNDKFLMVSKYVTYHKSFIIQMKTTYFYDNSNLFNLRN